MKQFDQKLQYLGEILSEIRMQLGIAVPLLSEEIQASNRVYNGVWRGDDTRISYYLRVYNYLYDEARSHGKKGDTLRQKMTQALLELFQE